MDQGNIKRLFPVLFPFHHRTESARYTTLSQSDTMSKVVDHDSLGEKVAYTHDEVMHFGELTSEELVIEKELRKKIDIRIMPLVVLVYLMNYIDRYEVLTVFLRHT